MKLVVCAETAELGKKASAQAAKIVNDAIAKQGHARILLSTGSSQFPFFNEFVNEDIDWAKVEMFHLDEYVGISEEHPASFKRYLLDRFVLKVNPAKYHLINGQDDPATTIANLTAIIREKPIDLGMIGIGENAHIAFNDPPADFHDERAYKVVTLDKRCLQQQIGEGWFKDEDECFKQAISMTAPEIMKCKAIISVVPHAVKAEAVYNTLTRELTPDVPATLLKEHADCTLYVDANSAKLLTEEIVKQYE